MLPCLREDLVVSKRNDGCQLVSDPVVGAYFLFSDAEYSLAQALRDSKSIEHWVEKWNRVNRCESLGLAAAERFLDRLIRDQLVTVSLPGYGLHLHEVDSKRSGFSSLIKNPLAIRLPGFNPSQLLEKITPVIGWLFHPVVMICVSILSLLGLGLLLFASEQSPQVPSLEWLTTPSGILTFVCVFVVIKILHEFGHALAADFHQARCRQIGVLFLFLMPTLYCDVSDAWRLENRWHRIAISAAGIYVELILAITAAMGWLMTAPGPLNTIFFQVMVLCSISTVLVNGNPLLRYDGYYILSDLLRRPNLNATARNELARLSNGFTQWQTLRSIRWFLVNFHICSIAYRVFIIVSLAITMVCVATEFSVALVGWVIAIGLVLLLSRALFYRRQPRVERSAWIRIAATFGVVLVVCFAVYQPLPRSIYVEYEVHPLSSQTLYATVDANLDPNEISVGQVTVNSQILTLANDELEFKSRVAAIELHRLNSEIVQLQKRCRIQPELNGALTVVREQAKAALAKSENIQKQLLELTISSAISGRVESLLEFRNPASESPVQVFRGQPIARVIDESKKQIRLVVDESKIDLLSPGQQVTFQADRLNRCAGHGQIGEILSGRWKSNGTRSRAGNDETSEKTFLVTVETDALCGADEVFSVGQARIQIAPATLSNRIASLIRGTFQFR
jgi:putative peptide zinc metalloprotease protein